MTGSKPLAQGMLLLACERPSLRNATVALRTGFKFTPIRNSDIAPWMGASITAQAVRICGSLMQKFSSWSSGCRACVRRGRFRVHSNQRGFSLVESTLSIGVVAFAFIAILGLLPAGLTVFRQAMDTSITAQIAQRVAADLQEADYFTLLRQASLGDDGGSAYGTLPRRFFDDQGNEIPPGRDGTLSDYDRPRALYEVHVRLAWREWKSKGLQQRSATRVGSRNLATAVIQIVNNPAGEELKEDPDTKLLDLDDLKIPIQTYPALVARNGSETR